MPNISVSTDYLESLSKLPKDAQRKAVAFTQKFRQDPRSPGINYEKIRDSRDPNLRSCRVDQNYRAIVLSPEVGDNFVLLWVAAHDDAYAWASRRQLQVNPSTGALQVVVTNEYAEEVLAEVTAEESVSVREKSEPLFAGLSSDDALKLGVPEMNLPLLRLIRSERDVAALSSVLPQEAYEALQYIAMGESVESILALVERATEDVPVTVEEALNHADSKRRFFTLSDEAQLSQMLEAPLDKWRVFLHPSQRKLVEVDARGSFKVLGGPGTGKTIVALHRACFLASKDNSRVLLTTYTKNLALDLGYLKNKLSPGLAGVTIENFHSVAVRMLKAAGRKVVPLTDAEEKEFWTQSVTVYGDGVSESVLRSEWREVILAQGIQSEEQYLKASRVGMRGRLDRSARKAVWQAVTRYRALCDEEGRYDWSQICALASALDTLLFDHLVVDEAQDLSAVDWRFLRSLVRVGPNDMFIVGDAHQRIYGRKIVLSRVGIETRGRSRKLRLNYRTTHEIKSWAMALFRGGQVDDLDDSMDDLKGYTSLMIGEAPEVHRFSSEDDERKFLVERILSLSDDFSKRERPLESLCIAARTTTILNRRVIPALQAAKLPYQQLTGVERPDQDEVCIATFHRVKGTEFPVVILVGVEEASVPVGSAETTEDVERERATLFVAATRAREGLMVTVVGADSRFLSGV